MIQDAATNGGGWRALDDEDEEAIRFATRSLCGGASIGSGGARNKAGRTLFAAAVRGENLRERIAAVVGGEVAVSRGAVEEATEEEVVPVFEVAIEAEDGAEFRSSTTASGFLAASVDEASSWEPDEISEIVELFREDIGEWAVEAVSRPATSVFAIDVISFHVARALTKSFSNRHSLIVPRKSPAELPDPSRGEGTETAWRRKCHYPGFRCGPPRTWPIAK